MRLSLETLEQIDKELKGLGVLMSPDLLRQIAQYQKQNKDLIDRLDACVSANDFDEMTVEIEEHVREVKTFLKQWGR